MGAVICGHKYSDLWKVFDKDYGAITVHLLHWKFKDYFEAIQMLRNGQTIMDPVYIKDAVYKYCKDMTFLEIFE